MYILPIKSPEKLVGLPRRVWEHQLGATQATFSHPRYGLLGLLIATEKYRGFDVQTAENTESRDLRTPNQVLCTNGWKHRIKGFGVQRLETTAR